MEARIGMRRFSAVAAAALLAVVGAMHLIWAFTPWPLATWGQFGLTVLGTPDGKVPAVLPPMSVAVAVACWAGAYLLIARVGLAPAVGPRWLGRVGVLAVAVVMLGRATVAGFVASALHLAGSPAVYERWDLMLYSPLCLLLGALAAVVALSSERGAGSTAPERG
jgi:hypothetical protein